MDGRAAAEGISSSPTALGERKLPLPALPGAHQIPNAGAALACLPFLEGFCIDGHAQMRGLARGANGRRGCSA